MLPGPPMMPGPPMLPGPPRPPTPLPAETQRGPGMLGRAVWFVFVGWWLTAIMSAMAWFAMVTLIGLPLGIYLINHIPTYLTLRPRTVQLRWVMDQAGFSRLVEVRLPQTAWWIRFIWFLVVGWWASAIVMVIGYLLIAVIITLPIGLWMYNRVPLVASLYRY